MKTRTIILALLILSAFSTRAQYNCSKFYPFEEGVEADYSMLDASGNHLGSVTFYIDTVSESGGVQSATMRHRLSDINGNQLSASDYNLSCADGTVYIDFNSFLRPGLLGGLGMTDYDITGTDLTIPNDLEVGDTLPDAGLHINTTSGMAGALTISFKDRTVVRTETITTPAGTYDCYVITFKMDMNMGYSYQISSTQWLSEGIGMVKQEDFDAAGNLMNSIVLQSFDD